MLAFTVHPISPNLVIVLTLSLVAPSLQVADWLVRDAQERKDYFGRYPLGIPGPVWAVALLADVLLGWCVGVALGKQVAQSHSFGLLKVLLAVLVVALAAGAGFAVVPAYRSIARRAQGVIPLAEPLPVADEAAVTAIVGGLGGGADGRRPSWMTSAGIAPPEKGGPTNRGEGILSARDVVSVDAETDVDGAPSKPVLHVADLEVFYGAARALRGVSFEVHAGEVVSIIGGNGAGKSTTLKAVSGVSELLKTVVGSICFQGTRVEKMPAHEIARMGVVHVPEGRRVFPETSVEDNLILGSYRRYKIDKGRIGDDLAHVYERFPVLKERRRRPAGFLSGGEQQMLAIGRGLMARPTLLLLDEPSLGLAPLLIQQMFEIIKQLAAEGTTILLVEQMANQALEIADRGYVLESGSITLSGSGADLLENPAVKAAYLGA